MISETKIVSDDTDLNPDPSAYTTPDPYPDPNPNSNTNPNSYPNPNPDPKLNPNSVGLANLFFEFGLGNGKIALRFKEPLNYREVPQLG